MPPKRGKAYKVYNISNNIHLQESTTDVDKLSYIGLAISEATALLLSLNKLYTGLQALYHQILSESKEHSKAKIENASAPKLLKATVEQHSESEGDEEYHGSEEEEEEEKIEPKKKVKPEVHPKITVVKPVIRPELLKALQTFGEHVLLAYHNGLKSLEAGSLVHQSQAHLNHYQHNQHQIHDHPHHMPEIDHMVYKRRKRGIETSRDVSVQEVRTALQSSKSQTKEEILPKLDVFIEGVATIYQLLTAYKDVLTNSYDHCAEEGCMSVISNHLKEFAKKTRELDDQIKTKFLKDPELQVKTAEELVAEYNLVINRAETLLKGVSAKEGKEKLEIDSDILWKVFELDLIKLRFKKDQPIYTEHLPQLEKLEALVSQELTKAQEYAFKFPEYVEKDNRWNSILLNSVFQVKRIEEIFKARWHEIRAFMQDKDHTNHSFRNWMYYQGKLPTGLKAHDSGAAVFMIIENARQYMNILNECVSIEATTKTLHIDWDKMARMGPFGRFTAAKLIENQESHLPNKIIYTDLINKRLRGIEKLLSAAKEVLFQLLSEQNQSSYWKNVIIDAHRKLHTSAMSMENKMRKLLGIHEQEEAARIARGEMDEDHGVESRGIYKKYNGSLDDSMLHLRNILSVPILEIVV